MPATRARTSVHWVARVLVALAILAAGLSKFWPESGWAGRFDNWGYSPWFLTAIAVLEVGGAIGLLIPQTLRPAAGLLIVILLGAAYTHLSRGEGLEVLRPLAYIAVLAIVLWLGPRSAKAAA